MSEVLIPKTHMFNTRRPSMLILHGTEVDAQQSHEILSGNTDREASAHYLIEEDGKIVQYLDEGVRAWHAGLSYWSGFSDINSASIGIELVCLSKDGSFNGAESKYTPAQMTSLIDLCREILARHKIPAYHVLAHQDIAPGRRFDPGIHFDWQNLAQHGIGVWHDLEPQADDFVITDQAEIQMFHLGLSLYGYAQEAFDDQPFSEVIRAFQSHFLPWNVCGEVTVQSVAALGILLGKKHGRV